MIYADDTTLYMEIPYGECKTETAEKLQADLNALGAYPTSHDEHVPPSALTRPSPSASHRTQAVVFAFGWLPGSHALHGAPVAEIRLFPTSEHRRQSVEAVAAVGSYPPGHG